MSFPFILSKVCANKWTKTVTIPSVGVFVRGCTTTPRGGAINRKGSRFCEDCQSLSCTSRQFHPGKEGLGEEEVEDNQFIVHSILAHKEDGRGRRHFLIHWMGWAVGDSTWEPESNISEELVLEFLKLAGQSGPQVYIICTFALFTPLLELSAALPKWHNARSRSLLQLNHQQTVVISIIQKRRWKGLPPAKP